MSIPDLNDKGLLPPGIYVTSIAEIEQRFATANHKPHREAIWNSFITYLGLIRAIGVVRAIYVDGGYVTNKTKPKDIDVVVELPPPSRVILGILRRSEFDHDFVKKTYKVDFWPWYPGIPPSEDFLELFQELKPQDATRLGLKPDARKGILKVVL